MYKKLDQKDIEELKQIVGQKNIITEKEKMEDYSHDEFALPWIKNYPEIVIKPENTNQVSEIIKFANREKIPVTPRGGATGLCGGCVPIFGGIVISFENMNRILEIDKENLMVVVEPGVTLRSLYSEIAKVKLFFPPHPGDESATFGGLVATNAGGARAVKYGVVRDFVRGLEVVLPNGNIINLGGKIIKDSTGYNLLHLMIGSEGTLSIITKVVISLLPPPGNILTLIVPYHNLNRAIATVPLILHQGIIPMAVEFMEGGPVRVTEDFLNKKLPCIEAAAYLMIMVDGSSKEEVERMCESIAEICLSNEAADVFVADTEQKQKDILDIRSQIYEALKRQTIEILDVVVPKTEIVKHVERVYSLSQEYGMWLPTYGHAADGNIHTHLMKAGLKNGKLDTVEIEGWKEKYSLVRKEIHLDAVKRGGKISGEHGIGIAKKEYLSLSIPTEQIELMKGIKKVFDPYNILNPGKIFDCEKNSINKNFVTIQFS